MCINNFFSKNRAKSKFTIRTDLKFFMFTEKFIINAYSQVILNMYPRNMIEI